MSESRKFGIFGIVLAVLILIAIGIYLLPNKSEYKLYYIGREGCQWCQAFKPNIESIKQKYGIDYEYIDYEKISSDELKDYLNKFEVDYDDFGTPTIALMKGEEFIASNVGYLSEQALYSFLKKNGALSGDFITSYKNLKYINFDDYEEIVESADKQFVVIAQDDCAGCEEAQEYLNTLAKEQGLKVNYFNVEFETSDQYNYFYNSYEFIKNALDEENLYTPTFIVVENNKVIDSLSQYTSEDDLKKLLKENGLIK